MAVPAHDEAPPEAEADAAFLRDSYLAYMLPLATDFSLDQALEQAREQDPTASLQTAIEGIEEREGLFFDETVDVYFVLRTPYADEARLHAYLGRLVVALEVQIINSALPGRESPPVVEVIFNGAVEDVDKPLAVVTDPEPQGEDDDDTASESGESETTDDNEDDAEKKQNSRRQKRPVRQAFVVWKRSVFLARPRARLQGPSVSFAAVASLKPAPPPRVDAYGADVVVPGLGSGYLRSREPSGLNLLAPLAGDTALLALAQGSADNADGRETGAPPRLSAQRVSRVAPLGLLPGQHGVGAAPRALKGLAAAAFRIVPAVHARVRFARPASHEHAAASSPAVVALLEVDFTPFFECEAVLTRIDAALPSGGTVTDLNGEVDGLAMPLYCVARDHFTFLYRLVPLAYDFDPVRNTFGPAGAAGVGGGAAGLGGVATGMMMMTPTTSGDLAIRIEARVLVQPGVCTPTLALAWTTGVDFAPPVNPGFGTALMPPPSLQRAHRPSQLSIDGVAALSSPAVPVALASANTAGAAAVGGSTGNAASRHYYPHPDALPLLEAAAGRSAETTIPDFGITMTFSAPSRPVYAGEEFRWTVFVVNRASPPSLPPSATSTPHNSISLPPAAASTAGAAASAATAAASRKLALLALPRRRRNEMRVLRPPSTAPAKSATTAATRKSRAGTITTAAAVATDTTTLVADAVLDENIVHAMQRSSLVDSTDVVCLSADVRVGPLAPHACHIVELRFVALRAGAVGIEAVRVVDLGSQEHVDVRELPAMVIAEGERPTETD